MTWRASAWQCLNTHGRFTRSQFGEDPGLDTATDIDIDIGFRIGTNGF